MNTYREKVGEFDIHPNIKQIIHLIFDSGSCQCYKDCDCIERKGNYLGASISFRYNLHSKPFNNFKDLQNYIASKKLNLGVINLLTDEKVESIVKQFLSDKEKQKAKKQRLLESFSKDTLIIGCNYHTTWQSNKKMRFILKQVENDKAKLGTRTTKKEFYTDVNSLLFILTDYNKQKALRIIETEKHKVIRI